MAPLPDRESRERYSLLCLVSASFVFVLGTAASATQIPIPIPRPDQTASQPELTQSPLSPPGPVLFSGKELTLEDAVFLGLRNNRAIKSAYIDRVSQRFGLRVAEDRFTPQFGVSGDVSHQQVGGIESSTLEVSPTVSLLTKTGATLDFAWNTAAGWQDSANSFSSAAQIGIEQPLLRGAGIEVNMAPVESARLQELVNKLQLKATVSETIASIIVAHRALLAAQQELQLAQASVDRAEDLLAMNDALIAAGRMAPMDAVQTQADIESQKLRVLQARQTVEASRLALLDLLAVDLSTKIVAVENLDPKKANTSVIKLLPIALAERQDYLGQMYVIEQNRLGITVAKNQQLWDVSLFAQARLGNQYSGGAGSNRIGDVTAGLKFAIPINDLSRQQQLVDANTTYQDAQVQLGTIRSGIEMQVRGTASQVDLLWQQLAVAEKSRDLALQAVTIEKAKLNAGRSTTFQVRSLEDNLRDSESQLLDARIGYMNALTQLDLQLGTTLATWHIDLKD
ncbi:TolC family protein [Neorhizobium sp. P12A]|uniref:TolC family protein n=1 Tax=Neorhizobium sp. P12A TaxID=2268027 RepID=UPI0011EDC964|nr:TolC family protein [Neorhizobium sp. P12A]KAA0687338.1 TolC family protein [Neorhizobium sp. P12A]